MQIELTESELEHSILGAMLLNALMHYKIVVVFPDPEIKEAIDKQVAIVNLIRVLDLKEGEKTCKTIHDLTRKLVEVSDALPHNKI